MAAEGSSKALPEADSGSAPAKQLDSRDTRALEEAKEHLAVEAETLEARGVGPNDLSVGDEVSLTRGPDTFFPVRYQGFTVGPVSAKTTVRKGETGTEAWLRLHRFVDALYIAEYEVACREFGDRLVDAPERIKAKE